VGLQVQFTNFGKEFPKFSTNVITGLDPVIHPLRNKGLFAKLNGLPGQGPAMTRRRKCPGMRNGFVRETGRPRDGENPALPIDPVAMQFADDAGFGPVVAALRLGKLVPQTGFEPVTPSLRMTCSTS
jgi:hypothetical protein